MKKKKKTRAKGEKKKKKNSFCGPALFTCVPTRWRDSLFVVGKPFKKRFGVATYFSFILKGENKIGKKNPKYDS